MSLIHIARHGQSLGIFQEEEVRDGIQAKRFFTEDLVWREGMNDWCPLHEVIDAWGLNAVGVAADGATPPAVAEPAWERRAEVGFFKAIFETIKSVLFHPATTFSKVNPVGGISAPLGYYVLMNAVMLAVALSYQLPQVLKNPGLLAPQLADVSPRFIIAAFGIIVLIAPLFIAIGSFITASLVHLSLKILGAAHQPWKATFRTFCYALGSASIFQIVPFIGGLLTFFYGITVCFIGLKKVHDCSLMRTVFSILLTVALVLIFLFGAIFLTAMVSVLLKHK